MSESERGCGFRQTWGLYLVSEPGLQMACDGLPIHLDPCGCCGFAPRKNENIQQLQSEYIIQAELKKHNADPGAGIENCHCPAGQFCPICYAAPHTVFGLMFVGTSYYTPESFLKEAKMMGISKRIPEIPGWLVLGETWVLLAHSETPDVSLEELKAEKMHMKDPKRVPAIFYAFKPLRVEMPVWKGDLTAEQILKLEKRGITPVLLDPTPENKKRHKQAKGMEKVVRKYLSEEEPEEE